MCSGETSLLKEWLNKTGSLHQQWVIYHVTCAADRNDMNHLCTGRRDAIDAILWWDMITKSISFCTFQGLKIHLKFKMSNKAATSINQKAMERKQGFLSDYQHSSLASALENSADKIQIIHFVDLLISNYFLHFFFYFIYQKIYVYQKE